jgi:hypothetical protein
MRILLTESDAGGADTATATLEAAGHEVLRCVEHGAAAFPCTGLSTGDCPVEGRVDVAVTVRSEAHAGPTERETGVVCALRHHVPVVVSSVDEADPLATWSTATVTGATTDLLAAVDAAAHGELTGHARVAAEEAGHQLIDGAFDVVAHRRARGIAVTVRTSDELDPRRKENLAVQVAGAVRRFDGDAAVIDVAVLDGQRVEG